MVGLGTVRSLASAGLDNVERHRRRINALNVYPVPDGDTGTNLTLTMQGIVDELERSTATTTAQLAADVQRAATMEAKGNSGVILSTIVRGMARVLGENDHVDGEILAHAMRAGATSAYQAVKVPVEGTMLTVIREMAEEAELPDVRSLPVADALARALARGEDAVERTPEMLDKLRESGVVDAARVEIGDMHSQAAERERWLAQLHAAARAPHAATALVAVAQGTGNRDILRSEGATVVIEGGQTMNPSVGQILEAVTAANAEHVIVLPNNPNVRLAAENAARESTKDVRVVPTASVPEGVAAAFAFDSSADVDANETAIGEALETVVAAEVTRASRDASVDGISVTEGQYLAILDGAAFAASDDLWAVVDALLQRFADDGLTLVHVFRSDSAPDEDELAARVGEHGLEAAVLWGGQPHYPLLLSAE